MKFYISYSLVIGVRGHSFRHQEEVGVSKCKETQSGLCRLDAIQLRGNQRHTVKDHLLNPVSEERLSNHSFMIITGHGRPAKLWLSLQAEVLRMALGDILSI